MKIVDSYSPLRSTHLVKNAHPIFRSWDYHNAEIAQWFKRISSPEMEKTADLYISRVEELVKKIELFFGRELPGELVLIPSMGEIDGFARYDHGHHTVLMGIDFPNVNLDYLRALTAHELSHVYRDHSPEVWGFLGKPLAQVSRDEYLEATSGREHLVSEGLATLNSQAMFPEIPAHLHHFYEDAEMEWCEKNAAKIDEALRACLKEREPDPWQFYQPGLIAKGAPSRTHYFWAAKKIDQWLKQNPSISLLAAHALSAEPYCAVYQIGSDKKEAECRDFLKCRRSNLGGKLPSRVHSEKCNGAHRT